MQFTTAEAAKKATELHDTEICGRRTKVDIASAVGIFIFILFIIN